MRASFRELTKNCWLCNKSDFVLQNVLALVRTFYNDITISNTELNDLRKKKYLFENWLRFCDCGTPWTFLLIF